MRKVQDKLYEACKLVEDKKREYGATDKAVESFLKVMFPGGISTEQYDDVVLLTRLLEKSTRIFSSTITSNRKTDAFRDLMGYALLGLHKDQNDEEQ